jgi:hypothetical protein
MLQKPKLRDVIILLQISFESEAKLQAKHLILYG